MTWTIGAFVIRSRILLVSLILFVAGCNQSPSLSTVQVQPSSAALTFVGQTVQFQAIGTYQRVGHPSNTQDISGSVTWTSSNPAAATVGATGLATAVGNGSTTITATTSSYGGAAIGTAVLSISGETAHDLTSITILPGSQATTEVGEPAQFLAFGTYNTPPLTAEITNSVRWVSSDVSVASVNSIGLSLANSAGSTTITAVGKSNSGADISGSSVLTADDGQPTGVVQIPTLGVYEVGLGSGTVTSSPASIECTSGVGCTAQFALGTVVTLSANPAPGSTFAGWSANCAVISNTSCTVTLNNNEPVGAIFDRPQ
jgi:trimeric autotransporter adhesin